MLPDDAPKEMTDPHKVGSSQIIVITQDAPKSKLDANLKPPTFIAAKWLNILTNPSVDTFTSEIPAANAGTTWLGIAIMALIITPLFMAGIVPSPDRHGVDGLNRFIFGYVITFFVLVVALFYGLSKADNINPPRFAVHAYLYFLYTIPLIISSVLLSLIPIYGPYMMLLGFAYFLLLSYQMVRAAYGYTWIRTLATIVVTLACSLGIAIATPAFIFGLLSELRI